MKDNIQEIYYLTELLETTWLRTDIKNTKYDRIENILKELSLLTNEMYYVH